MTIMWLAIHGRLKMMWLVEVGCGVVSRVVVVVVVVVSNVEWQTTLYSKQGD
jgi:hypothetical protein